MQRLALAQLDLTVGDLAGNCARIADACADAARAGADLVLAPELAISGYPPEDLVLRPRFLADCRRAAEDLATRIEVPLLVGAPWLDHDRVRNAALLLSGGAVAARYDKRELPNYGVFDEERTFSEGTVDRAIALGGHLYGLTVCEDLWLPDPIERLTRRGATVVLNISASPFHVGKAGSREEMLRTRGTDNLCILAYCNLVGGQDELVFDGSSVVIGPDGGILARAGQFREELLVVDIDPETSVAARLRDGRLRRAAEETATIEPSLVLPVSSRAGTPPARPVAERPTDPLAEVWAALLTGLRAYVAKNGFGDVVIGLSGGVDSALVAALAVDSLGAERVRAVSMPTRYNTSATRDDAAVVARSLGIDFRELPIEELRLAFHEKLPETSGVAAENLQARIRGVLLMTLSNQHGWLVLTTSNKSETAVGYSTLYGDTAGGFAPIKDVPKTLVFALCRHLNEVAGRERIPVSIIDRPPSAELRDEQRDDQSLPPYDVLDVMLEAYVEQDLQPEQFAAPGDLETARRLARLVDLSEYKRRQSPPGIKLRPKAFGRDRRVPITNRYRPQ